MPSTLAVRKEISSAKSTISQSTRQHDSWLNQLRANGRVTNVEIQGKLTQFLPADAKCIHEAMESLNEITSDLQKLDEEVINWKEWWAPWSKPAESTLERIIIIMAKQKDILDKFAQSVIPQEEYSVAITK